MKNGFREIHLKLSGAIFQSRLIVTFQETFTHAFWLLRLSFSQGVSLRVS